MNNKRKQSTHWKDMDQSKNMGNQGGAFKGQKGGKTGQKDNSKGMKDLDEQDVDAISDMEE